MNAIRSFLGIFICNHKSRQSLCFVKQMEPQHRKYRYPSFFYLLPIIKKYMIQQCLYLQTFRLFLIVHYYKHCCTCLSVLHVYMCILNCIPKDYQFTFPFLPMILSSVFLILANLYKNYLIAIICILLMTFKIIYICYHLYFLFDKCF